ncbi:hypothetical protein QVD17_12000 [Tagetes erecta]|uniref:Uncharacterized protein n=1 Tax=Tagetes erecta TaxID=13708 RepID=A0AAD8KKN3_TARER|nr:hypothetical protein QVD17_24958 [Tagetes erecta]KAK1429779.1 hypothetical protein QVD17_12000 [Tagetes erecta]
MQSTMYGNVKDDAAEIKTTKAINNEYVKEDVAEINIEKKVVSNPMKTEKQIGYCELNSPENDASKILLMLISSLWSGLRL